MSLSADIKNHLCSDAVKRGKCCVIAFDSGRNGGVFFGGCNACLQHYIAGVFVEWGTVSVLSKGYHLAIKPPAEKLEEIGALLEKASFPARVGYTRSGKPRLYYKNGDVIIDLLTYMGAGRFSISVLQDKVDREMKAKDNRRFNAELANVDRAATAAAEQNRAVALLKEHGALGSLPKELAETARIREENPFMPLGELCLQFSPPISKSGLNHRLKRLVKEADKLEDIIKGN